MRLSPAFQAVQQLPRRSNLKRKHTVRQQQTTDGKNYIHIALPEGRQGTFTLNDVQYQTDPDPSRVPHVSIYEMFRLSEQQGMGVFHCTEYFSVVSDEVSDGASASSQNAADDNDATSSAPRRVIVHVYFNQSGVCIDVQVKGVSELQDSGAAATAAAVSIESVAEVIPLTPIEKAILRRHALQNASPVIAEILQYIQRESDQARTGSNKVVSGLEQMRLRTQAQKQRYLAQAKRCITALEKLDAWSFGRKDTRLSWFRSLVTSLCGDHVGGARAQWLNRALLYLQVQPIKMWLWGLMQMCRTMILL